MSEPTINELLARIERLEARVRELEERQTTPRAHVPPKTQATTFNPRGPSQFQGCDFS